MSKSTSDAFPSVGSKLGAGLARICAYVASDRGRNTLASLLLALNLVLLVVYLFTGYKGAFHSDSSVRSLLAQEMHDTGSFFPPGWNYVNKDLMVVFPQLGVWLLLFFTDNSYAAFAVVGAVTSLLILTCIWWFSGLLGGKVWQRLLALAALAGGISANIDEDIFGQAAYGVMVMLTCLTAMLSWSVIAADARRRPVWLLVLVVVVALLAWSNPQRALATYVLPLCCGLLAYLWGKNWEGRLRALLPVLGATAIGCIVGVMLSTWTLRHVNNNEGVGAARWLGFDGMVDNAAHTLQALMALLGGIPTAGGNVIGAVGIYAALRMSAALILLVLMGWKIVELCRSSSDRARFAGGLVAGVAACFLFLHVTTTIADMTDPVAVARYLAPTIVLCLVVLLCSPLRKPPGLGAALVVGLALLLATGNLVRFSPGSFINPGWMNPQRDARIDQLKSMGLRYGYAGYWNAGVTTVLTDGGVKTRQINIFNGLPLPMRHLSSDRWYEPEAWQGESFLLLEDVEVAAINWGELTRYVGQPVREARIGSLRVFVFPRNIAEDIPGWSMKLRKPVQILAAPDGSKTVGQWTAADGALRAKQGQAGFLQYGPYMVLGRGRYTASFEVSGSADPAHQVVATLDVVAEGGSRTLGAVEVKGDGVELHTIEFSLDEPVKNLELRVLTNGAGEVTYKGILLAAKS